MLDDLTAARLSDVRETGEPRLERRHLESEDHRPTWCRPSNWRWQFDRKVVVEAAVPNAREIECAVLGNDEPGASLPGEIIPSREFYDYEAKYLDDDSKSVIPADLPADTVATVKKLSIEAFRAIDAAGLARVDFLLARDTGEIVLNEINTMPGFTSISMYSKMWEASGVSYAELVHRLIQLGTRTAQSEAEAEDERVLNAGRRQLSLSRWSSRWWVPRASASGRERSDARQTGITAAPTVARAYDLILDADFDGLARALPSTCPPAPSVACLGLEALSLWWQIQLDPESLRLDAPFVAKVECGHCRSRTDDRKPIRSGPRPGSTSARPTACGRSSAFTGSSGSPPPATASESRNRSNGRWRSTRRCTTPSSASACIAITPTSRRRCFRFLRFLLLMPGGDRVDGLRQLERAATRGILVRGEALYQIHVIYLWYEQKWPQALEIIRTLQSRYPRNPLFRQIEAEILDVYFHDAAASLKASEQLLALAASGAVHRADIAAVVARLNIARQLIALKQPARAAAVARSADRDRGARGAVAARSTRAIVRSPSRARSARQATDPPTTSRHHMMKMCVDAIDRRAKVGLQQTLCA